MHIYIPRLVAVACCLLVAAPLAAGEKTDAAAKELRTELESVDKLLKEMDKSKPAKAPSNGWMEFKKWCDAAHEIKADFDAGWYIALTDLESKNNPPPTTETMKEALARTTPLPALAAEAVPFEEIARPSSPDGTPEALEVLPIIDAFKYGVGRVVLLERTGRGDDSRGELRVIASVLGKMQSTQDNLALIIFDTMRSLVIESGLLLLAGKPGYDAAFLREIIALMPEPSTRPSVLMGGELRFMAASIRTYYLAEADVLETLKKNEESRMKKAADADAEGAKILAEVQSVLKAIRTLVEEDRKQAIDTGKLEGMKRVFEAGNKLGDNKFIIWQPGLAALRRSVLQAAIELKLLELEKGALVQQKPAAEKVTAKYVGVKLTWDGDAAIVALDEKHEIAGKGAYTADIRLKPIKR